MSIEDLPGTICDVEVTTRSLSDYRNQFYHPGGSVLTRIAWYYSSLLLLESSWFPVSRLKCSILRLFGAQMGQGVVIHPNVRIKYPWKLRVGDNCWIGRDAWIDNLDTVTLESDVCVSQGAYLCTGSHDHRSATFDLKTGPIVIKHGAWICCRATVLGGSTVPRMTLVPANQVFSSKSVEPVFPVRKPR